MTTSPAVSLDPVNAPYDLVVIGGGSGGVASARRAAAHGAKVALIERDRLGGTCVIRGCVPKKLMMYAAKFGRELAEAGPYGWDVSGAQFNMATWQANKRVEIDRLEGIYSRMLENSGVTVFRGNATVRDAQTVLVDGDHALAAKRILIATGGRANRHAVPGIEQAMTSDDILDLYAIPKRLGVLGAGYIALEFASIMQGLGSEVTVFYRDHLPLRGFDESMRVKLAEALTAQGITLMGHSALRSVARTGDTTVVCAGDATHTFDAVLNATGRSPNVAGLGLEALGVDLNADGAITPQTAAKHAMPARGRSDQRRERGQQACTSSPPAWSAGMHITTTSRPTGQTRDDKHCEAIASQRRRGERRRLHHQSRRCQHSRGSCCHARHISPQRSST